jgi:hypothetical protein
MSPARFVTFTLAAMAALVVLTGALLVAVDPYWLWREAPPWTENGRGENRLLNTQMRFAKALQVVTRQPELILIGSSRVYRGMDPERLSGPAAEAYNLGLSSMRIHESVAYLRHALRWTRARTVVFGFDFFAFDARVPWEDGFDPDLGTLNFVLNAFPSALTNVRAALALRRPQRDPDGTWAANGFKHSEPRSADMLERLAAEASNLRYDGFVLDESGLAALADVLHEARGGGLELRLFISPLHEDEWALLERAGLAPRYAHWQRALYALAAELELTLWDFTAPNPFAGADLTGGSNRYYLDVSHYSPVVGDLILDRLGFRLLEPPPELAWSFGRQVVAPHIAPQEAN